MEVKLTCFANILTIEMKRRWGSHGAFWLDGPSSVEVATSAQPQTRPALCPDPGRAPRVASLLLTAVVLGFVHRGCWRDTPGPAWSRAFTLGLGAAVWRRGQGPMAGGRRLSPEQRSRAGASTASSRVSPPRGSCSRTRLSLARPPGPPVPARPWGRGPSESGFFPPPARGSGAAQARLLADFFFDKYSTVL